MTVDADIQKHHSALVENIRRASDASSHHVLSIGKSLGEVVASSLEIKELVHALRMPGADIENSADSLARPADVFAASVQRGLASSRELLHQAQAEARAVGKACEDLLHVTGTCRTLVMHTRIESARLGARRSGISATGEHMSAFTSQMIDATLKAQSVQGDLVKLLDDLGASLDRFAQQADRLRVGLDERLREMSRTQRERNLRYRQSVDELTEATDQLVQRSQEAVSSLQFQDFGIQRLQRLDSLCVELMAAVGNLDRTGDVIEWGRRLGDAEVGGADGDAADVAARTKVFRDDAYTRTEEFERQCHLAVSTVIEVNDQLGPLSEAQVRAGERAIAQAEHDDMVLDYLAAQLRVIHRALANYQRLAVQGAEHCNRILDVQRSISKVARRAETPAINVSLQASKAGAAGRPMAVIASEMVVISRKVSETTERIQRHVKVLLEAIPALRAQADLLVEHGARCQREVGEMVDDMARKQTAASSELEAAMSEVHRVRRTVLEATETVQLHFQFARDLGPTFEGIRDSSDRFFDAMIAQLGVSEDDVGESDWGDHEVAEHEAGELILF